MKYLNDYTEQATTKLFNDNGAFFAFGDKQLAEQRKKGVEYTSVGFGLIVPKENAKTIIDGLDNITKQGIKDDIAENGIDNIIKRELSNHEAYYTGDLYNTSQALQSYNIPNEKITEVYNQEKNNHQED